MLCGEPGCERSVALWAYSDLELVGNRLGRFTLGDWPWVRRRVVVSLMGLRRIRAPQAALLPIFVVLFAATGPLAQTLPLTSGPVLPLYRELRSVGLDPQQTYKIREATIDRDAIHLYLNDGVISFAQTVGGHITGAYFEGDGEVLIRPPDRRERASLGLFTGQGVLEEHFTSVYLRFNDDTAGELQPYLRPSDDPVGFATRNDAAARRLAAIDAMRLTISFSGTAPTLSPGESAPAPDRLLHARIASVRLGTFDVYFDSQAPEQIAVGQVTANDDEPYYDLWMSFQAGGRRDDQNPASRFHGPTGPTWTRDAFRVDHYTIDATIDSSLSLSADATLDGAVRQGGPRILMFELSRYLRLKSVELNGQSLEYIQNEAIEGSELSRRGNDLVAIVFPQPLQLGRQSRLKFTYSGMVLTDAGGGLFSVGARGTWYPNRGIALAKYDISFRFPRSFTLVATGEQVSMKEQGPESVGRWVSDGAIPVAGFNLGRYIMTSARAGNIQVRSYATREVENSLPQPVKDAAVPTQQSGISPEGVMATGVGVSSPAPALAGVPLVERAAETVTSLENLLGPFPFDSLSLTQRPGPESQGWPGMIFLSSYVYLTPEQRAAAHVSAADNVLYGQIMMPHEVAHQWFGDRVSWVSYHEQWLLEALANYSAIMLLEQRRPADARFTLQTYRELLKAKSKDGLSNVEAGPVTLGVRLSSSKFPMGYEIITYGRGTWLIHMLREMFRDASRSKELPNGSDEVFIGVLRSIYQHYQGKEISNEDFEAQFEAALPKSLWFENSRSLDWFFDGWVNGTVLPRFELRDVRFSAGGGKSSVTATLKQLDAPDDLVTSIPVYGVVGDNKVYLGRVFAEGAETRFTLPAPAGVKRLLLDPNQTVLTAQ